MRAVSSRLFGALFTCAEGHHAFWADIKKCKSMAKLSDDDKERFISIRYLPTPVCQYFVLPPVQIAIYETQIMVANNQRHKASQRETKTKNKNSKPLECILGIINAYLFSFSVF